LRCVVVCIYFRATGPIGVTYSKRRARSEWKLYQVRLRCVKGARIPISKDILPIDVEATVYGDISLLRRTENGYAIPLGLGVLLLHFYVKRYTDQSRYYNISNKKHASICRPVLFLTRRKQCNATCQRQQCNVRKTILIRHILRYRNMSFPRFADYLEIVTGFTQIAWLVTIIRINMNIQFRFYSLILQSIIIFDIRRYLPRWKLR